MRIYAILLTLLLQGCAYTAVSTGTYIVTGKSVGDHAATVITGNNCDTTRYVIGKQDYLCERAREPGTTYNRHEFW
jgi:hypothetical protein